MSLGRVNLAVSGALLPDQEGMTTDQANVSLLQYDPGPLKGPMR